MVFTFPRISRICGALRVFNVFSRTERLRVFTWCRGKRKIFVAYGFQFIVSIENTPHVNVADLKFRISLLFFSFFYFTPGNILVYFRYFNANSIPNVASIEATYFKEDKSWPTIVFFTRIIYRSFFPYLKQNNTGITYFLFTDSNEGIITLINSF